jgi:hypothetical protein
MDQKTLHAKVETLEAEYNNLNGELLNTQETQIDQAMRLLKCMKELMPLQNSFLTSIIKQDKHALAKLEEECQVLKVENEKLAKKQPFVKPS